MWLEGPAIQVGTDPSRQAEAGMPQSLVMQAIGKLMAARFQDPAAMRPFVQQAQEQLAAADDVPLVLRPLLTQVMSSLDDFLDSLEEVQENSDDQGGDVPDMQIAKIESIDITREFEKGSTAELVRKIRSKWDISFPQSMLWRVLGCAAGFAITMVRERTQGTFLRLQVAPISRGQVFAGKATACFLSVICVIMFLVLLGSGLGMRPENPLFLVLAALCVAFCFVGVMMLMSVVGKTKEAVSGAAWFANIMMAMFGGGMIPLAFMPGFMKTLSQFQSSQMGYPGTRGRNLARIHTNRDDRTLCRIARYRRGMHDDRRGGDLARQKLSRNGQDRVGYDELKGGHNPDLRVGVGMRREICGADDLVALGHDHRLSSRKVLFCPTWV